MTDTWDFMARTPAEHTTANYPLRGELGKIHRGGKAYERWQHKPTAQGDARIGVYVDGRNVWNSKARSILSDPWRGERSGGLT